MHFVSSGRAEVLLQLAGIYRMIHLVRSNTQMAKLKIHLGERSILGKKRSTGDLSLPSQLLMLFGCCCMPVERIWLYSFDLPIKILIGCYRPYQWKHWQEWGVKAIALGLVLLCVLRDGLEECTISLGLPSNDSFLSYGNFYDTSQGIVAAVLNGFLMSFREHQKLT